VRLISAERITGIHRQLASRNRELAEMSRSLMAESRRDPLTNVGNRLRFQDDVARLMDEIRRYGHRFCLGMCDIDNFKQYNDTYGHLAGDQVLRAVAQALAAKSRASDLVYRMGGEEFLVILSDQDTSTATIAAERLRREVEALDILHERNAPHGKVTLTIGIAPFHATNPAEVDRDLRVADSLLYQGKMNGRNQVVSCRTLVESSSSAS
jgi:diguanylate cyclase (GGDEF)-like protein